MDDALAPMRMTFLQRVGAPRPWGWLAFAAPRPVVLLLVALAPPAALLLLVGAEPSLGRTLLNAENVRNDFGRWVAAVASVAVIAVSIASVAFRKELRSLRELREHREQNHEFHDRIGHGREAPVAIGPLLGEALLGVASAADRVEESAEPGLVVDGVALRDYLGVLRASVTRVHARAVRAGRDPAKLYAALLDVEDEQADHLAMRFRAASPGPAGEAWSELRERLEDVAVGRGYVKTLSLEWGFSRMSSAIMLTLVPALTTAMMMSLLYSAEVAEALGTRGAALLIAGALFVFALPMGAFLSSLLRYIFVNQYTLPSAGFVLGPEEPELVPLGWREAAGGRDRVARPPARQQG
ncbi:MAG: hypothetical protein LC624_02800 [Halobacteriales archaeon]|nr:hypothetical protein [Halobacteriales archaeon]